MHDPANVPRVPGNPVRDLPLPDLAGFTHRWVDAGGVRLHAVDGGQPDGPAVVLLAGFPQTWWAWRKVMPKLAGRCRVVAIDLPGQGHSERPDISYARTRSPRTSTRRSRRSESRRTGWSPTTSARGSPSPSP